MIIKFFKMFVLVFKSNVSRRWHLLLLLLPICLYLVYNQVFQDVCVGLLSSLSRILCWFTFKFVEKIVMVYYQVFYMFVLIYYNVCQYICVGLR